MSSELARRGYRERLVEGDTVYFVEGETWFGSGNLTVKKASVDSTTLPSGEQRHYPFIAIWPSVDEDPGSSCVAVSKSPRELFTPQEVIRAIVQHEGPLGLDERRVDELIVDPIARLELTAVLGSKVIERLAEDEFRRPGDPEY